MQDHNHPTEYDLTHNRAGDPYPVISHAPVPHPGYDQSPCPAPADYVPVPVHRHVTLSDVPWTVGTSD